MGREIVMSTIKAMLVRDMARAFTEAGLSVIPIKPDGTKAPALETWAEFQTRIATPEEVRVMFRDGLGIAIVGGDASGSLEILDIEAGAPFDEFCDLIKENDTALLDQLVHVATPSGGNHLFYRCDEIAGNQKLAMHLDEEGRPNVDFETRGRGGYVVTIGSPAECHPDRKEYRLLRNRLTQIPRITPVQRSLLLDAARSFNRVVRPAQVDRRPSPNGNCNGNGKRPGDVLNTQATWSAILKPHGWTAVGGRGEETLWRRPGKNFGFSATTNYKGSDLLYVFSTNAHPFEHETSYCKFTAYALLNHGGDYKAAARTIAQRFGMKDERSRARVADPMDEERQAIQQEGAAAEKGQTQVQPTPESYIEFAPQFLAIEDPPIRYLIPELLPEEIIALMHGEPRTRKSWAALEIAIALSTGRPAFGLSRFSVPAAVPVLYLSQEDGARPVRTRVTRLLRGYGLDWPGKLAFAIHRGIDLGSPEWQRRLIEDVKRHGFRLVVFDPIRRFCANADKGPAEVQSVTAFLRRLVVETGSSVDINHHDVKPGAEKPDTRRRSHKASGGDWFAASECPIAFEPAGENRSLVIPEDYKFSIDPKPFTFRIEEDAERKVWARLVGEDSTTEEAQNLTVDQKVLDYVTEHRGTSGSAVAKGCQIGKEIALAALDRLRKAEKLDSVKPDKKGKATTWFARAQNQ
jgi:putative DNA primase/helicase